MNIATSILSLAVAAASLSAADNFPADVPRTLSASAFDRHVVLDSRETHRWQAVLKAANLQISEAVAAGATRPSVVRVAFAAGGWVEFEPSYGAVETDSLPRIYAMQFRPGRAAG